MRCSRLSRCYLYAGLVGLLLGLPQSTQAQEEGDYVLRTYEVGDLILNISDRPYGESTPRDRIGVQGGGAGGFGGGGQFGDGGGGGVFSVPEVATKQPLFLAQVGIGGGVAQGGAPAIYNMLVNLQSVIVATVEPDSWSGNGGPGSMEPFGTALVVWQTEPVHQRIKQLLEALRAGSGDRRTVKVDARWLLLNSDDLAQLTPEDDNGKTQVDREALARFTRRPTSIRGLTHCFSGQLVYVVSGTKRNVISGYIPVVGSVESPCTNRQLVAQKRNAIFRFASDGYAPNTGDLRVGYQPIVHTTNLGALLEIRPTLVPGTETVVVDLSATITVPGKQSNSQVGDAAPSLGPPLVDRNAIETQQLATTLRVPLKEPVVVGGLTYQPASILMGQQNSTIAGEPVAVSTESPQLYLILQIQ